MLRVLYVSDCCLLVLSAAATIRAEVTGQPQQLNPDHTLLGVPPGPIAQVTVLNNSTLF